MAFDLLRLEGDDLRWHPLEARREAFLRLVADKRSKRPIRPPRSPPIALDSLDYSTPLRLAQMCSDRPTSEPFPSAVIGPGFSNRKRISAFVPVEGVQKTITRLSQR
jgi:hypothetical protein